MDSRYIFNAQCTYNPHVHLEFDSTNAGINEAEIKAMQQERYKFIKEENKRKNDIAFFDKYNQNVMRYQEEQRLKNREEQLNKLREQNEQIMRKQLFNKTVYENNMKPILKEKEKLKKSNTMKTTITNPQKEIKINFNNNNIDQIINFKQSATINNNNPKNNLDDKISDLTGTVNIYKDTYVENKQKGAEKKEEAAKNEKDEFVVDLRDDLEAQLMSEINNRNKLKNKENNVAPEELDNKLNEIKKFRTYGFLPANQEQNENLPKNKKKKIVKNNSKNKHKFSSEFEKRRFIKAMKNIFTERLGEHNIYIQNICNCGNLQKQLTALVEKGNLTVYELTDVECANNCIFYKKPKEYLKCINDVLNSIKDIAYENFHNKYKDK